MMIESNPILVATTARIADAPQRRDWWVGGVRL